MIQILTTPGCENLRTAAILAQKDKNVWWILLMIDRLFASRPQLPVRQRREMVLNNWNTRLKIQVREVSAMKISNMKSNALLFTAFCCAFLASATSSAETTTTTTTTTNPDGTTTTTVEETTTTGEPETTPQETQPASQPAGRKLVGPAGVTGTIRRADRRQDRRLEEDLDDLEDALEGRPRR
jgi:hypothetical protein